MRFCRLPLLAATLGWVLLAASGMVRCEDQPAAEGKFWALLIGCEKYTKANALRYTVNDVRQLVATLRGRADGEPPEILEFTDQADNGTSTAQTPTKANLLAQIPAWLQRPGPKDTILIYFTGHGFRDSDGKMYLAPLDVDAASPALTGIPVAWFREQIAACPAGFKLLVLDACHAGSEKGEGTIQDVKSNLLGQEFQDLEKVVTIASSTAQQPSQIWDEKQQSLFSYWLNQALKGHADSNLDGTVDIDEIYRFTSGKVTQVAKERLGREQNPVRIVRPGTLGVPTVIRLRPFGLDELLAEAADQLANTLSTLPERDRRRIGVLEFLGITGGDNDRQERWRGDYGALGRYCAERLERQLMDMAGSNYRVVDHKRLGEALAKSRFSTVDLASNSALSSLSKNTVGGMPLLVEGKMSARKGQRLKMEVRLVETIGDDALDSFGGVVALNESEWAMRGRSVEVHPEDHQPKSTLPGEKPSSIEATVIERIDERADSSPHPMLNPKFPYRVSVRVKTPVGGQEQWRERQAVFKGNDMIVQLRKGEVFGIFIENRTNESVVMRLLVDGLNTLPEKAQKGLMVEAWGQRVNLDSARHWVIYGNTTPAVLGFVTQAELNGELREFQVADVSDSLAAQQNYTDQIGLVTAAFYKPVSDNSQARAIGVRAGDARKQRFEVSKGIGPGNLFGVVNIHYVEAK